MKDEKNQPAIYYELSSEWSDPGRIKKERERAQKLKKTQWWLQLRNQGVCHYCQKKFLPQELTMDHVVPLARGGGSTPGNIVPCCRACNRDKKLETPAETLLRKLKSDE